MNKATTLLTIQVGLTIVFAPPEVLGQEVDVTAPGSDSVQVVVISEKSPFTAGALEYLIPTLGYGYAGNWKRGLPSATVRLVGFGLFFDHQFTIFGSPPPCEGRCVTGVVLMAAGTLWAIIDASAEARRYNERERQRALVVAPSLGPDGWGLRGSLSIR